MKEVILPEINDVLGSDYLLITKEMERLFFTKGNIPKNMSVEEFFAPINVIITDEVSEFKILKIKK